MLAPGWRCPERRRNHSKGSSDGTIIATLASHNKPPQMRPILLKGHERSITCVKYNADGEFFFDRYSSKILIITRGLILTSDSR